MIIAKVLDAIQLARISRSEREELHRNLCAALDVVDTGDEFSRQTDTVPHFRYIDTLPAWMAKDVFEKSIGQYKFQHLCRKLDGEDWKDALWLVLHQYHDYMDKMVLADRDRIMEVD